MFFVLTVEENESGLRGKIKEWFSPPEVTAERITPDGGLSFFCLKTKICRGIIPWDAVSSACGKLKKRALLPEGLVPDRKAASNAIVRAFCPKGFFSTPRFACFLK